MINLRRSSGADAPQSLRFPSRSRSVASPAGRLAVLLLCLLGSAASSLPAAAEAAGRAFHVDAAAGDDAASGEGAAEAWASLDRVNQETFRPGDEVRFRRGQRWEGSLVPRGSGEAGRPVRFGAFGEGDAPVLDGAGSTGGAVVHLHNLSHVEVADLEITNDAPEDGDRRGVKVSAENAGTVRGIHLLRLHIHHVRGIVGQSIQAKRTGGIYLAVVADDRVDTRFDDVRIDGCHIHHVGNSGIASSHEVKQSDPPGSRDWTRRRFTNVRITGNRIHHVAKNGMILRLFDGGLVDHNFLHDTAIGADGEGMTGNTIFTRSSRGVLLEFNEGTRNMSPDFDGALYDADLLSSDITFRNSYSHDNAHGLYWGCTENDDRGIVVRNNLSVNDRGGIFTVNYPTAGTLIEGNTVIVGADTSPIVIYERARREGLRVYGFQRNLIFDPHGRGRFDFHPGGGGRTYERALRDNLFFGITPPAEATGSGVVDPELRNPGVDPPEGVDFHDPHAFDAYLPAENSPLHEVPGDPVGFRFPPPAEE